MYGLAIAYAIQIGNQSWDGGERSARLCAETVGGQTLSRLAGAQVERTSESVCIGISIVCLVYSAAESRIQSWDGLTGNPPPPPPAWTKGARATRSLPWCVITKLSAPWAFCSMIDLSKTHRLRAFDRDSELGCGRGSRKSLDWASQLT